MLIDESLPKRLRRLLPGFETVTVQQRGWSRMKNGVLLRLAEQHGFDVFITADQSLQYQQNLTGFKLRIVVLAAVSNRIEHVGRLMPAAIAAMSDMEPGELRVITEPA